jgi:uncharacterized protein with von Willebrand factor type A (vWA) domain
MRILEHNAEATICTLSADMQFLIKGLKKALKETNPEHMEALQAVSTRVRTVQKKAQRMEKRLAKYLNGIESMGFKRAR